MSEFNLLWRRYGLREDPYFIQPIGLNGGLIPPTAFVGRKAERAVLKGFIQLGSGAYVVKGSPGVGKTSLVNVVRGEAAADRFFTPQLEIEINSAIDCKLFLLKCLSAIYAETKRLEILLPERLQKILESLHEVEVFSEEFHDTDTAERVDRQKLHALFNEVVKEVVYPRFFAIILHFDNLDNIDKVERLARFFADIRDVLYTSKVIFIFVGDDRLPAAISIKERVRQVFRHPPLSVDPLTFEDIKKILDERIVSMRLDGPTPVITPHTEDALRLLFDLHDGVIREILNSLSACIVSTASSNVPIRLDPPLVCSILPEKAQMMIAHLSPKEKEVLSKLIEVEKATPKELSQLTGKQNQNISSKYLPALVKAGAVRLYGAEGRNKIYGITAEMKWLKLAGPKQQEEKKERVRQRIEQKIKSTLLDFFR